MPIQSGLLIAIDDDGTGVGSFTQAIEVESCGLRKEATILDTAGIRGTRSHVKERTRAGGYTVQGDIVIPGVSPADLDFLLPYIMGTAESTDVFALAENLDSFEFAVLVDVGSERHLYDDCKVNRATFSSTAGDFLNLTLNVIGKTATESATAFPSITPPIAAHDAPFIHSDVAVTLEGTGSRQIFDFELVIDNVIVPRFTNSLTATALLETDRIVTCKCSLPYDSSPDTTDLYDVAVSGAAATFLFTNAASPGLTLDFTLGSFQIPARTPTITGRGDETIIELEGIVRKSGSTMELVITNDSVA